MTRIAAVCRRYPPEVDAEGLVTQKWVEALRREGTEVDVFSLRGEERPTTELQGEFEDLGSCWWARVVGLRDVLKYRILDGRERFAATRFLRAACAAIVRRGRDEPYDLIVGRSEPAENIAAAEMAARELRVPWIASFNDPVPRIAAVRPGWRGLADIVRNSWSEQWVQRALDSASVIVFPTEQLRSLAFSRLGGSLSEHQRERLRASVVIPHIGGGPVAPGTIRQGSGRGQNLIVRHVGALTSGRSVDDVLRAIDQMECKCDVGPIVIEFIGDSRGQPRLKSWIAARERSRISVVARDPVRWDQAWQAIAEADVLLLVEEAAGAGVHLPSKFCDYAIARKPIVALSPIGSCVSGYLKQFGGGVAVAHGRPEELAIALCGALRGDVKPSELLARQFTPERSAERWREVIGRCETRLLSPSRGEVPAGGRGDRSRLRQ